MHQEDDGWVWGKGDRDLGLGRRLDYEEPTRIVGVPSEWETVSEDVRAVPAYCVGLPRGASDDGQVCEGRYP